MIAAGKSISALACTLAAILALAGCGPFDGDSGEIPASEADRMLETLGELESAAAEQDCTRAQDNVEQLMNQATPVEGTVGDDLEELVGRAEQLVNSADWCIDTGTTGAADAETEQEPDRSTTTTTDETTTTTTDETQPDTTTDDSGSTDEPSTDDGEDDGSDGPTEFDPGSGNPPPGPEGNPSGGIGAGGGD